MAETSTMSSKGQVVVPKRVREALQANNGARIGFELKGDKAVMFVVRKKTAKPEDGYGLVKGKGRKVALEDWDAKLGAALDANMRAVDTNILTRYFRQDDSRQSPAALRVMAGRAVFCSKTVVLEFEWVMRHVYRHEPADIARCLTTLLKLPNVIVEDEQQVIDALRGHERGMDFADALHLAASHGCEDLVTFDARRFARRAKRLALKPPVTVPAV